MSNTIAIAQPASVPSALADLAEIDAKTVAATAGISVATLYALRAAGRGPKAIHHGPRCTRYRVSDVREWMASRAAAASAEPLTGHTAKLHARQAKPAQRADAGQ